MEKSNKKDNFHTIYDELVQTLSIIFLNKDTISALKKDNNLQKAMIDLLSVCNFLEAKLEIDDIRIDEFKIAYTSVTNKTVKLNSIKQIDEDDIKDKINYVKVVLKNSYNLDWEAILVGFTSGKTKTTKTKLEKTNEDIEVVQTEKVDDNKNAGYHYSNSEDFLRQNNVSLDDIADGLIKQQASFLLRKDILENKFYQFDSKPKIFKIVKYALYGFWLLFLIGFVITIILSFVSKDFALANETVITEYLNNYESTNNITFQDISQIRNVLFNRGYLFNFPTSMSLILGSTLLVVVLFMTIYYVYKEVKNFKNDNIQYAFRSYFSWCIIILGLIQIVFPLIFNGVNNSILSVYQNMLLNKDLPSFTITIRNISLSFNNVANLGIYSAYYVFTIILICLIGIIFLVTVSLMIIKPKLDINRINDKIKEYYEDIKSGRIKFDQNDIESSGFGSFFGSGKNPFSPI